LLAWAAVVGACGGSANLLLSLDGGAGDGGTKGVSHDATAGRDAARDAAADGSTGPVACRVPPNNFNCEYWRGVLSCGPVDGSEVSCPVDRLDGGCGSDGGPDADSCIEMCHPDEFAIACVGPPRPDGGTFGTFIPIACRWAGNTGYGCCACALTEDAGSDDASERDAGSDGACGVAPWVSPGSEEPTWVTHTCPEAGCAVGTVCVSSFGPFLNELGCAPIPSACNGTCACMSCVCGLTAGDRSGCDDSDGGIVCQTGLP